MNAKAILSSKGQLVIPKALRDKLGLHAGIELSIQSKKRGTIELVPVRRSLNDFFGKGGSLRNQKKADDVDLLIEKAILENDRR